MHSVTDCAERHVATYLTTQQINSNQAAVTIDFFNPFGWESKYVAAGKLTKPKMAPVLVRDIMPQGDWKISNWLKFKLPTTPRGMTACSLIVIPLLLPSYLKSNRRQKKDWPNVPQFKSISSSVLAVLLLKP
jgi:hypothetical protein